MQTARHMQAINRMGLGVFYASCSLSEKGYPNKKQVKSSDGYGFRWV